MSSISKLLLASLLPLTLGAGPLQNAVVRAVLFYSPSCPHCHTVIRDHLPGMFERFGGPGRVYFDAGTPEAERAFFLVSNGELEILLVNVAQPEGNLLYRQTAEALAIPEERLGVPRLVIRDSVLVGSFEIPEYLPALIEEARTSGGVDWPRIDGLNQALAQLPSAPPIASAERDRGARSLRWGSGEFHCGIGRTAGTRVRAGPDRSDRRRRAGGVEPGRDRRGQAIDDGPLRS